MSFCRAEWFGIALGKREGGILLVALLFFGLVGTVWAEPDVITDDDLENSATNDGAVDPAEYSGYTVGINGGAGDVIGQDSKIYVDAGGAENSVHFGLVPAGDLTVFVVIYIDSIDGGFSSTVPLTAGGSYHERSISAPGGTDLHFAPNFYADYAVSLYSQGGRLYELAEGSSLTVSKSVNLQEGQDEHAGEFEFDFLMSDIGLIEGGTFKYVATLVNPQTLPIYRYDEFQGVYLDTYTADGNWNGGNTTTDSFTLAEGDYNLFSAAGTTHVGALTAEVSGAEPGAAALLWPLLLALLTAPLLLRRRR